MKKNEERLLILEKMYLENNCYTIAEISNALGVGRTSVYNYIKRLGEKGYTLIEGRQGHAVTFTIEKKESDLSKYLPISRDILKKNILVHILTSSGPKDISSLMELIEGHADRCHLGIKEIQIRRLLAELLDSGDLVKTQVLDEYSNHYKSQYLPVRNNLPLAYSFNSKKDIVKLWLTLKNISPGHPYYSQLSSLKDKVRVLIGENDDAEHENNYFLYGRKHVNFASYDEEVAILKDIPFETNALRISYKPAKGRAFKANILTGAIVYSLEKDKLYLIGKKTNTKVNDFRSNMIFDLQRIQSIEVLDSENCLYRSSEYSTIIRQMFSISVEEPVEVQVEFQNIFQIAAKLTDTAKHRENARVKTLPDKVIYSDYLRGIDDFRSYLRQFGSACKIISPDSLKDKTKEALEQSLRNYESL